MNRISKIVKFSLLLSALIVGASDDPFDLPLDPSAAPGSTEGTVPLEPQSPGSAVAKLLEQAQWVIDYIADAISSRSDRISTIGDDSLVATEEGDRLLILDVSGKPVTPAQADVYEISTSIRNGYCIPVSRGAPNAHQRALASTIIADAEEAMRLMKAINTPSTTVDRELETFREVCRNLIVGIANHRTHYYFCGPRVTDYKYEINWTRWIIRNLALRSESLAPNLIKLLKEPRAIKMFEMIKAYVEGELDSEELLKEQAVHLRKCIKAESLELVRRS